MKSLNHRQTGATMIEIMIAILVFSVGLLGIASTQTLGLTNTQSSLNRSYATQLSYELIDIMRVSRAVTRLGAAAGGNFFDEFNTTGNHGLVLFPDCLNQAAGCDSDEMAEDALVRWEMRLEDILPNGQALIELQDPATQEYLLVITWVDLKLQEELDAAAAREDVNGVVTNNIYRFELEFAL